MPELTKSIPVRISLSPQELATLFCNMDCEQMAFFFNHVSRVTSDWDRAFCMQMQYLTDNEKLDDGGRSIMSTIGDYSAKQ